jgi:hypothetical protein
MFQIEMKPMLIVQLQMILDQVIIIITGASIMFTEILLIERIDI